jgi:hypothetical protein
MISPFFSSSRERARYYPFYRLRLLFTLKATVFLFTFLDAFWGWLTNPVIDGRMLRTNKSQWRTTKSNDFSLYLFSYVPKWVCTPMGRPPALLCSIY